jgi:uncharacterized protein
MSRKRPKLDFRFYLCYDVSGFLITLLPGGGVKQINHSALRINVGFLLHQDVGFSRKFEFNEATVQVTEELDVSNLIGEVQFTRTAQGLYAQGKLKAQVPLECVRCLSGFDQQLTIEVNDLFNYPPEKDTDPLLTIPKSAIIDMTELVREYLVLDIPIQPICDRGCEGMCAICGNRISEGLCEHPEKEIDPRMAVLQSLLSES